MIRGATRTEIRKMVPCPKCLAKEHEYCRGDKYSAGRIHEARMWLAQDVISGKKLRRANQRNISFDYNSFLDNWNNGNTPYWKSLARR